MPGTRDATVPPPGPREIAFDCRFFLGDRPCVWHKRTAARCTCEHYQPIDEQLLIVKLDAMGDVLRTTALLPPLTVRHPRAAITWITRAESVPLLEGNPYLHEVLAYGPDALVQLAVRRFDRVINLDAGRTSAALAVAARAPRHDGYVLDDRGRVRATNAAARRWLETGLFDDVKRQGRATYQDAMAGILGLVGEPHRYVLELSTEEQADGWRHLAAGGARRGAGPIVGLNTGAGGRWERKRWRDAGYRELAGRLARQHGAQVVLLGGPDERDAHERLRATAGVPLIDAGCDNPVRRFAAVVAQCDVVVTGDTLAMHIALALGRRVVALFGPTSAAEVELYGLGEKVVPEMSCLSCYRTRCDLTPGCMDLISVDMVEAAAARQLARVSVARGTGADESVPIRVGAHDAP